MKYIRFKMEDKKEFSMEEHEAKRILESPHNLVPLYSDGEWTGETINKLKVMYTERDVEAERRFAILADQDRRLNPPEVELSEEGKQRITAIGDILRR